MTDDNVRDIELQAGPLRLAARARGAPDAPPVLALHGWLDNAGTFERLAPCLTGLRIVALDLPGHGHSDHRPPGCRYHFTDYVDDVLAAADALGWERFSLLGHSLGGAVAAVVAAVRPQRIERLALIEAIGPLSLEPAAAVRQLDHALTRAEQASRPARVYPGIDQAIEARQAAGDLSMEAARHLVDRGSIAADDGIRWRSDPRLRLPSPFRFSEEQVLAFLGAIEAPTLLVAADDGLLPELHGNATRRCAAVSNLRVEQLPGRHHLHLEDPAPVAGVVGPFLRDSAA